MTTQPVRRITLCADDYGISPGVNRGIRELIDKRRINATSVMVVGPAIDRAEVSALTRLTEAGACALGLHLTLTAPFHPLTMHFRPLRDSAFLPHAQLLIAGFTGRLDTEIVGNEILAQLTRFADLFGRPPDYVDGHQHAHLFPRVREAVIAAMKLAAPAAWARQCGREVFGLARLVPPKALVLDLLSRKFRRLCEEAGIACNPAFAGAYDFNRDADFAALTAGFLAALPDRGLMMCHPGFVDDVLEELDPLTTQREREYAFLAGDAFAKLLQSQGVTLVR